MGDEENNQNNTTKMAAIKMPDRLSLGGNAIKNWKLFKQRWQTYSVITELNTLPAIKQRAIFIHCLDDDALEAFNTFQIAEDETVDQIITSFDNFIVGETNVTYERYVFNRRTQEEGESFDFFYADLQRLIKSCDYCDNCRPSLLKDRIVLGIQDASVQKELLKIRNLTLQQTVDTCKANEKAVNQNRTLRPEVNKVNISKKASNNSTVRPCKFSGK